MKKNILTNISLFLLNVIVCFILYKTFISFRYQHIINQDIKNKTQTFSFEEVSKIPLIPNVGVTTMPIKALLAPYIVSKNPEKAFSLLKESSSHNPHIYYGEYLMANFFFQTKQYDSAYYYANKAFYNWPKNLNHYKFYNKVLEAKKDTVELLAAYDFVNKSFKSKEDYYLSFVDSYSNAKLRYLIFKYPDASSVLKDSLIGEWQQMYEFEGGKVRFLKKKIVFEDKYFRSNGSKYYYDVNKDTLNLKFVTNKKVISQIPIYYSDSLKTLILKNIPTEANVDIPKLQDQFFKKINN